MNKILKKLNSLNERYDYMEENTRFCVFLLLVCVPVATLLTFAEPIGFMYMLFLFLFRAILPKMVRD